MSEPAKDEAELVEWVADAMWGKSHEGYNYLDISNLPAIIIAGIREAGWAVVPVALMENAVDELEENANGSYPHRDAYPEEMRRYMRDMELPTAIRAMLAAAPGVK